MTDAPFDGRVMYMLHDMFRREFCLMPGLVRCATVEDRIRAQIISGHIKTVTRVLRHHHATEDEYSWPLLLERCAENMTPLVRLMQVQHEEVASLGREVDEAMTDWRGAPTVETREALANALDRLVPALKDHLSMEEELIVPLMEQYVTAAEWHEIVRKSSAGIDPETLPLAFGMLMYEGDPELVAAEIANMPPDAGPAVRRLAAQAFAAHSRLVHGTPTPQRCSEL